MKTTIQYYKATKKLLTFGEKLKMTYTSKNMSLLVRLSVTVIIFKQIIIIIIIQ